MSTINPNQHKAGDSFTRLLAIPPEFADGYFVGWTVKSQVRTEAGELVSECACSWLDAVTTRNLKIRVANTTAWAPGRLLVDVQFTRTADSEVMSTTTATIHVVKDVTQ